MSANEYRNETRLEHMLRFIDRIIKLTEGATRDSIEVDGDKHDALLHNFIMLGEAANRITRDFAAAHPDGICVVWRPHGYAPLRKMLDALATMFAETIRPCDQLLLLPVYDAGGTTDRSINSDALAAKLPREVCVSVSDLDAAYDWCAAHRGGFAAFVTAGARDPGLPVLAKRLAGL